MLFRYTENPPENTIFTPAALRFSAGPSAYTENSSFPYRVKIVSGTNTKQAAQAKDGPGWDRLCKTRVTVFAGIRGPPRSRRSMLKISGVITSRRITARVALGSIASVIVIDADAGIDPIDRISVSAIIKQIVTT